MNWKLAEVLLYNQDYKNELGKTGKTKKTEPVSLGGD